MYNFITFNTRATFDENTIKHLKTEFKRLFKPHCNYNPYLLANYDSFLRTNTFYIILQSWSNWIIYLNDHSHWKFLPKDE